ncbi:MAG: secretin N-terminal domain-containing protein, partial [Verrucomicrobiota bacterium]
LAATADVKVYPLKNARASTVATTLTQFFQAKRTADSIAVNANQRTIPATVLGDDRVNSILVTGGKEAFELVDRLLPQLDGESVFSRLNFRVFPLKKATALKLQATLQPIFANRPPKVRGEPVDPITIIADQWINALLVGATVEDLSTVASLVEKLDSDPTETGIAIHVFPLLKADARRVATTVQGLFRENLPNQVVPITVTADERINALVVSCGETDAQRIGELVRKLDTDQVARVSEIRVFPLRYARAETLSAILNTALNTKPAPLNEQSPNAQSVLQFITRTEDGRQLVTAALKEAVLITPDPRVNSLIVSGPVDYMGLLEQIIERLDASAPQVPRSRSSSCATPTPARWPTSSPRCSA